MAMEIPTGSSLETLSVPQLVGALCYYLAVKDSEHIYLENILRRSKVREALYRLYRNVAFSQLLGLDKPTEQRSKDAWAAPGGSTARDMNSEDLLHVTSQWKETNANLRVSRLKDVLVGAAGDGSLEGISFQGDGQCEGTGGAKETKIQNRCDLVIPNGFEGSSMPRQMTFLCSEGENVFKFLDCLKGSDGNELKDEHYLASEEAWLHTNDRQDTEYFVEHGLNRGTFASEFPHPNFIPGPFQKHGEEDRQFHNPEARGWFIDQQKDKSNIDAGDKVAKRKSDRDEFLPYHPSRSPVKVSLGSLFLDKSPGKMTSFEITSFINTEEARKTSARKRISSQGLQDKYSVNGSNIDGRPASCSVEAIKIWSGEESEIAKDALLALCGVRTSLSKLRGRLMLPQALPRPATLSILASIEKAASSRACIEYYINRVLFENLKEPQDPIRYALAHSLKDILLDVDTDLVKFEIDESKNWVQPLGIKDNLNRNDIGLKLNTFMVNSAHPVGEASRDAKVNGAEYHGAGVSILSLAHATAGNQTMLFFLESFLDLEDIEAKNFDELPKGKILLEFIYEKSSKLEGEQAQVARRLFLACMAPYISLISDWAFGIEKVNAGQCFIGTLDDDYSIKIPSHDKQLSMTWTTGLGPSDIPSFFSEECKKSLIVAGTQLRLLYSASRAVAGVRKLAISLSMLPSDIVKSTSGIHEPWFTYTVKSDPHANMFDRKVQEFFSATNMINNTVLQAKQSAINTWFSSLDEDLEQSNETQIDAESSIFNREAFQDMVPDDIPLSVLLETSIGSLLSTQARIVSRACLRLFIDHLDTFGMIQYMRNIFMGFSGDFQSAFLRHIEPSINSLEQMTLHKVRTAVMLASSNSSLKDSVYAEKLHVSLLPGENAVSLSEEAFAIFAKFSEVPRIKSPYHSAMKPMLVPPTGNNAFDCINLTLQPSWPLAAILSEDTVTAYSAIFCINIRIKRCLLALHYIQNVSCRRGLVKKLLSVELVPWIAKFRIFRSFCFRATMHLCAISHYYQMCCSGNSWDFLKSIFNRADKITIHELIKAHRQYVYEASGRIITCSRLPYIKQAIEGMVESILSLKFLLEGKLRFHDIDSVFADEESWLDLKRFIAKYDGLVDTLRQASLNFTNAYTEDERIVKTFLQCFT